MKESNHYNPSNIAGKDIDFKRMWLCYYLSLCKYAQKYIRRNEDAHDLVQALFSEIIEKCQNIHIKESLSSYLYMALRNRCLSFNLNKNTSVLRIEDFDIESITEQETPYSIYERQQNREILAKLLNRLSPQQKEIIKQWMYSYSYYEIADNLGISINSVRTQLCRAKNALRNLCCESE
jgi:RNA polymerase sigma-70 factor (ECF subfamily)